MPLLFGLVGFGWIGLGVQNKQCGASESEAQPPFVWRGRATSSGEEEAQSEGEGKRAEEDEEEKEDKWVDTRGLLSKIVDVFMREPMDSLYRFWLASCVEAFLRGGRWVCAPFFFVVSAVVAAAYLSDYLCRCRCFVCFVLQSSFLFLLLVPLGFWCFFFAVAVWCRFFCARLIFFSFLAVLLVCSQLVIAVCVRVVFGLPWHRFFQ